MSPKPLVTPTLWLVAAVGTVVLGHARYVGATSGPVGYDFRSAFWPAAQAVTAGESPYSVEAYVYSPVVALLLAPFTGFDIAAVFSGWTVLSLASLVLAALIISVGLDGRGWRRPVLFGAFVVTGLHFWPTTIEVYLGQVNGHLVLCLAGAVAATHRGRGVAAAVLLGLGGVVKTWPFAFGAALLARPRRRELAAFASTALIAPTAAVLLGGGETLSDFLSRTLRSADQALISHSVWGFADYNFSSTGRAAPLLDQPVVQVTVAIVLALILLAVAGIVAVRADAVLTLVHLPPAVVMLLPVSHIEYLLFALPLLWVTMQRALERPNRRHLVAVVVLLLWWVVVARPWPDIDGSPDLSSLHYSVVFLTTYVAWLTSALLACLRPRRLDMQVSLA